MKEENLFHRRFSLCPNATSPPKIDPSTLTRNLSYGEDNDLYNLSPGKEAKRSNVTNENVNMCKHDIPVSMMAVLTAFKSTNLIPAY